MSSIIDDCSEGARRIRDIVLNLRTFSRLDEGAVKQIDIHEGIDSTIRLLSKYYCSNHITLERDYGAVPPVECFAGQLNQVWMNLLTNAAQAIGRGPGKVRIETRVRDEMVVVGISDTGAGIKPEDMKEFSILSLPLNRWVKEPASDCQSFTASSKNMAVESLSRVSLAKAQPLPP